MVSLLCTSNSVLKARAPTETVTKEDENNSVNSERMSTGTGVMGLQVSTAAVQHAAQAEQQAFNEAAYKNGAHVLNKAKQKEQQPKSSLQAAAMGAVDPDL
jgi:hypothetical protein